jgi:hypothetical protein
MMLEGGTGERCFGTVGLSVQSLAATNILRRVLPLPKGHTCSGLTEAHSSGLLEVVP